MQRGETQGRLVANQVPACQALLSRANDGGIAGLTFTDRRTVAEKRDKQAEECFQQSGIDEAKPR